MQHLTPADYTIQPWKNGKGRTIEMWRREENGRLLIRLSRATVTEDGPFSVFPGIARNLTLERLIVKYVVGIKHVHVGHRLLRITASGWRSSSYGGIAIRVVGPIRGGADPPDALDRRDIRRALSLFRHNEVLNAGVAQRFECYCPRVGNAYAVHPLVKSACRPPDPEWPKAIENSALRAMPIGFSAGDIGKYKKIDVISSEVRYVVAVPSCQVLSLTDFDIAASNLDGSIRDAAVARVGRDRRLIIEGDEIQTTVGSLRGHT